MVDHLYNYKKSSSMMFSQKPFYFLYKIGKKKWFYKILTETLETYWTKNPDFISFSVTFNFRLSQLGKSRHKMGPTRRVFHGILIWGIKNTLTMKKMKKYETHPLFRGNRPFAIESIITMKKNFKKFAINSGFCRELPINSQWPPSGHWELMGKFPPKTTISYTNSCGF